MAKPRTVLNGPASQKIPLKCHHVVDPSFSVSSYFLQFLLVSATTRIPGPLQWFLSTTFWPSRRYWTSKTCDGWHLWQSHDNIEPLLHSSLVLHGTMHDPWSNSPIPSTLGTVNPGYAWCFARTPRRTRHPSMDKYECPVLYCTAMFL